MKSKKTNKNAIIAVLSVIIAIVTIITFVPMQFGNTTYTGIWGSIGISSELNGGLYAEYDILGEASHTDIIDSMALIKSTLEEQGYPSSNVSSIDDKKIRVEIGYPKSVTNSFRAAYSALNSVAIGAFEFRSSSGTDYIGVTGKDHIEKIEIADYNGTTYLSVQFNEEGEKKFEELCTSSSDVTIYVYMGTGENALQTSFSASGVSDYSQMQLSIADYKSAKDFYFKAMFGSISITLNPDTFAINTMSSPLNAGFEIGYGTLSYLLLSVVIALIIAFVVYLAVRYKMMAVLFLPLVLLNASIAGWIFAGVSVVEINFASLIALIFGFGLIFTGVLSYINRIADEYKTGKTIDASIEAGTKKARPAQIVTSIVLVVLPAVFALFIKGQVASAFVVVAVFGLLNALTNIVLLPWFVSLYNKSNRQQGKPFGLKQQEGSDNV